MSYLSRFRVCCRRMSRHVSRVSHSGVTSVVSHSDTYFTTLYSFSMTYSYIGGYVRFRNRTFRTISRLLPPLGSGHFLLCPDVPPLDPLCAAKAQQITNFTLTSTLTALLHDFLLDMRICPYLSGGAKARHVLLWSEMSDRPLVEMSYFVRTRPPSLSRHFHTRCALSRHWWR